MSTKKMQTVIVLRNDSSTAWATSEKVLSVGELGVGYIYEADGVTVKNIIVKAGNGKDTWANLPQVEGVFEDDVILTYNFGKHTTTNGFVNAGGKGMTTSQWLLESLRVTEDPSVTAPSYALVASTITTNTGTSEIGSKVVALKWDGTFNGGSYEFGSKVVGEDEITYSQKDGTGVSSTCVMSSTNGGELTNTLDGTLTLDTPIVIKDDKGTSCGSITGDCSWTDSPRIPVNNVGELRDELKILAGSSTKTASYSVTGYREGFFYGAVNTALSPEDVDSAVIRKLNKTGAKYAPGKKTYSVPVGAASIILAWDASKTGVTDILNTTVNAVMNSAFNISSPYTVAVGGADATDDNIGEYASDYKFVIFTPAEAYESATSLTITLG